MAQVYRITEQCSGKSFECEAGQSVLKAMEQRGMKCVPVGCRGGGCGYCKIQVLAGEFECGKMSKVHVPPEALKKRERSREKRRTRKETEAGGTVRRK